MRREEGALGGPGAGRGGNWGSNCHWSGSRLVLGVLAHEWACPFPYLQKADDLDGTRLFRV